MSDEPAQGNGKTDVARLLHAAARERIAGAVADLFLPEASRLSEWHRGTMFALVSRLVRAIEDDLRASLAESFDQAGYPAVHAALTSANVELALPILLSSAALRDAELVSLLLRRVEEHRLHRAAVREAGDDRRDALLLELVRDKDQLVARSAMALLIAQNRRLDRFQEPLIGSPELPAEIEHRLVWTVAAALRRYLVAQHRVDPARADHAIAAAAADRLSTYDEGEGLEARCLQLASRLHELGRLDGQLIARSMTESGLPLLLAALAIRCQLALDGAWEMLSDPAGHGPVYLLRAAGLERDEAIPILFALAGAPRAEDDMLARQLDLLETMTSPEARDAVALWQFDPAYRAALALLDAPSQSSLGA